MFQAIRENLHSLLENVPSLKGSEDFADQLDDAFAFTKRTPAILIPAMTANFNRVSTAQTYGLSVNASLFLFCYERQSQSKLIKDAEKLIEDSLKELIKEDQIEIVAVSPVEAMSPLLVYNIQIVYKPYEHFGE